MRLILAACAVTLGCGHDKPAAKPAPPPAPPDAAVAVTPPPAAPVRLYSDAEIAKMLAVVDARLVENKQRTCPAPKLLGPQTPGPSASDVLALADEKGASAACLAKLKAFADLTKEIEARGPGILAVEKDCGPSLEAAVHAAASHQEGCSPYQPGVNNGPFEFVGLMQTAKLLGLRARLLAEHGDPMKGMAIVLDMLRVAQDLSRGHATLIAAMIGTATTEIIGAQGDAILDKAKLAPAKLGELASALDRLLAAVPEFEGLLASERDFMGLMAVAPLEPEGWTPPGGYGDMIPKTKPKPDPSEKHVADPRDEAAAFGEAVEVGAADRARACGPGASLKACTDGLAALAARPSPTATDTAALYAELASAKSPDQVRLRIRKQIVDIMVAVATPSFSQYVTKYAGALARVAELRLHVEALRGKKCPTAAGLAVAPYAALLSPALLGEPLAAKLDKGALDVAAPFGGKVVLHFTCPK